MICKALIVRKRYPYAFHKAIPRPRQRTHTTSTSLPPLLQKIYLYQPSTKSYIASLPKNPFNLNLPASVFDSSLRHIKQSIPQTAMLPLTLPRQFIQSVRNLILTLHPLSSDILFCVLVYKPTTLPTISLSLAISIFTTRRLA